MEFIGKKATPEENCDKCEFSSLLVTDGKKKIILSITRRR